MDQWSGLVTDSMMIIISIAGSDLLVKGHTQMAGKLLRAALNKTQTNQDDNKSDKKTFKQANNVLLTQSFNILHISVWKVWHKYHLSKWFGLLEVWCYLGVPSVAKQSDRLVPLVQSCITCWGRVVISTLHWSGELYQVSEQVHFLGSSQVTQPCGIWYTLRKLS